MKGSLAKILLLIDNSFITHTGYKLPAPENISERYNWLHTQAPYGLLVHNNNDDPKFIYANQQALHCFKYSEQEMMGMPSRFSASEKDRRERQDLLSLVMKNGIACNYTAPRINKFRQAIIIHDGVVWQIYNADNQFVGQAALFWPDKSERPLWFNKYL